MAQSKRTFQGARMEKDLDERLIQPGFYRDALNVSVSSSEDANVGAIENLKGNELLGGQTGTIPGLLYINNNPQSHVSYIQFSLDNSNSNTVNLATLTTSITNSITLNFGGDTAVQRAANADSWRSAVGWPLGASTFDEQQTIAAPITLSFVFSEGQTINVTQPIGNIAQNYGNKVIIGNPVPNPTFSPQTGQDPIYSNGSGTIAPYDGLPTLPENGGGTYLELSNIAAIESTFPWIDPLQNIGLEVIGSIPHPVENKIYYFITGSQTDGVVEYDLDQNVLNPILLDSTEGKEEVDKIKFTFEMAIATGTVSEGGKISLSAVNGIISTSVADYNVTVDSDTERRIYAKVRVPNGYSNSGRYVEGEVVATQPAVSAPNVFINRVTDKTDSSVSLNGFFNSNPGLTDVGFKYIENSGGSASYTNFSNKFVAIESDVYNDTIELGSDGLNPFFNLPSSDISVVGNNGVAILSTGNWEYTSYSTGQVSTLKILNNSFDGLFPIIIGQASTVNNITTGVTLANLQSSGTSISAAVVGSPFTASINSLSPDTEYIYQSFATNASSTTYSNFGLFRTAQASISLPTFSAASATAGTETVIFKGTPNNNGGDAGAHLYVVSSETSSTLATLKANAKTILGGGVVAGYIVETIGSWISGSQQSVTIATTGGATRYGLVFAKNASPIDGGDGAGYVFDASIVSAQANVPSVGGQATFSGTIVGPTGQYGAGQTLTWSVNGTSTVTVVPVGGHTLMHSDVARTGGTGNTWHPGGGWIMGGNTNTVGGTQSWNYSETTTAPTTPGTYSWRITLYYDSANQSGGVLTGSFTIPAPLPTSGTFTLDQNLIIGPYVGQAYGGSNGTGLLVAGPLPSNINVGTLITLTFGGSTNVIQVTSKTSGSTNSFIGYNLYSGSGGTAASAGTTINWSI